MASHQRSCGSCHGGSLPRTRSTAHSARSLRMRAAVTSLPTGDRTMYASIRTLTAPPGAPFLALGWMLIRSGNTLITLDDHGSAMPAATEPDVIALEPGPDSADLVLG